MRDRQRKIEEAKHALRAHERAKVQAEVAGVLEQFEVAGVDQTHDEMISRIDEETARNEARIEVALDSVDATDLKVEQDAEAFQADEIVRQIQLEMQQEADDTAPEQVPEVAKTMGLDDAGRGGPAMKRVR